MKVRKGRYSPCFYLMIGIENHKFISKDRFYEKWDEAFEEMVHGINVLYTQEERNNLR